MTAAQAVTSVSWVRIIDIHAQLRGKRSRRDHR